MKRAAAQLLAALVILLVVPGCADAQQRPNPRQRRDLPQRVAAQEPRCRVIDETVVDDTLRVRSLACTRIDTVMDTIRTTATPLSAAPPVAGADGTNPPASEECTVVVTEGQAPQPAVEAAEPGDVICLRGTFGLDLGFRGGGIGRNGSATGSLAAKWVQSAPRFFTKPARSITSWNPISWNTRVVEQSSDSPTCGRGCTALSRIR